MEDTSTKSELIKERPNCPGTWWAYGWQYPIVVWEEDGELVYEDSQFQKGKVVDLGKIHKYKLEWLHVSSQEVREPYNRHSVPS